MKRFLLILLALTLLALAGCGENGGKNNGGSQYQIEYEDGEKEPDGQTDTEPKDRYADAPYVAEEYAANPTVAAAQKLSDTEVRVRFSAPVHPTSAGAWKRVTVGGASAVSMTMRDLRLDETHNRAATVYDFTFEGAVPASEQIVFSKGEGDVDRALVTLFCGGNGEGLYASAGENGAPYAAVAIGEDEIEIPEVDACLVAAYCETATTLIVQFSKPVRCLKEWPGCAYICDVPSPTPDFGDSWQFRIASMRALDTVKGSDGRSYAATYRVTIEASKAQMENKFAATPVLFRITENDEKAPSEVGSSWDNRDIGRVVVSIDGSPVVANHYIGWDVAYVPITRAPVFPIEITK